MKTPTLLMARILSEELGASSSGAVAGLYWSKTRGILRERQAEEVIQAVEAADPYDTEPLTPEIRQAYKEALVEVLIQHGWQVDRDKVANGRLLKNCLTQQRRA